MTNSTPTTISHRLVALRKGFGKCACGETYAEGGLYGSIEAIREAQRAHKIALKSGSAPVEAAPVARKSTKAGTTFTATAPDGTVLSRTSKTMNYAFCVAVGPDERSATWGAWGWSQSEKGAHAMASQAAKVYGVTNVRAIPVN